MESSSMGGPTTVPDYVMNVTKPEREMASPENPFSETGAIVAAAMLIPMAIFGVAANLLTIVVIGTSKTLRSVFNTVIISLCVSDLIAAINSPLNLYRRTWGFNEWVLSDFVCKLYIGTTFCTCFVTALHILLFSIIRLISMQWPYRYKEIKKSHIKICVGVMWLITFLAGMVPGFVAFAASGKKLSLKWPDCTIIPSKGKTFKLISTISYPILVYIPIVMTAVFSIWTAISLLRRRAERVKKTEQPLMNETTKKKREESNRKTVKKENHAMLQLGLIVGSFMFGYIPLTAYIFETTRVTVKSTEEAVHDWNYWLITYTLLRVSECLNPIFYNIASSRMRRETVQMLSKIFRCCPEETCTRFEQTRIRSRSSFSTYSIKYTPSSERRDTIETVIPKLTEGKTQMA